MTGIREALGLLWSASDHAKMVQEGKTWHTWHTDQHHNLPIGAPQLMMGFTADGQLHEQLVTDRDQRFDVSSAKKRENRADIPTPQVDPDANAWQKGVTMQLEARQVESTK